MITADSFRLDGKVAVVTGSGRNIGRSIAESLASLGAKVVVNGHSDVEAINSVVDSIRADGREAIAIKADVSRDEDVGASLTARSRHSVGSIFWYRMSASGDIARSSRSRPRNGTMSSEQIYRPHSI